MSLDSDLIRLIKTQSLPNKKYGEKKFDLKNLIQELRFDHMGIAGTDRNWFILPEEDIIPQQFRGHFQSGDHNTTSSHNTHSKTIGTFQVRGTTSMSTKSLSCEIFKQVRYPLVLGGFIWQRFRGKGGHNPRITTFYIPCKLVNGKGSTYMQHLTRFNKINRDICPRQAMLDDIITEAFKWKVYEYQIIIMVEINVYV